jgi:hypothetical protein
MADIESTLAYFMFQPLKSKSSSDADAFFSLRGRLFLSIKTAANAKTTTTKSIPPIMRTLGVFRGASTVDVGDAVVVFVPLFVGFGVLVAPVEGEEVVVCVGVLVALEAAVGVGGVDVGEEAAVAQTSELVLVIYSFIVIMPPSEGVSVVW